MRGAAYPDAGKLFGLGVLIAVQSPVDHERARELVARLIDNSVARVHLNQRLDALVPTVVARFRLLPERL